METRTKSTQSNQEFRDEVHEVLGRHESSIDCLNTSIDDVKSSIREVNSNLTSSIQMVLAKLEALETSKHPPNHTDHNHPPTSPSSNPSQTLLQTPSLPHLPLTSPPFQTPTSPPNHRHNQAKLIFPTFSGDDPTSWQFRAEQYFEFQNIPPDQHVQLASFHFEGLALQWLKWCTKFRGPLVAMNAERGLRKTEPFTHQIPSRLRSC